ncbi:cobalt ECF transporter T component CbiQ [Cutibacterium sp.]|uniref:cobalt ECF transporter T component CbiQ n=1 Tax=Cutibacterium sp. TaxID=1912221 RepID=UPI0026DC935E|nr:cobalt ECF transporter T component CbiQ [Cutibacterium sp.]MDO4412887.1 cobalt ECF transporter T component CbiQ [Cutibacterium sp.]
MTITSLDDAAWDSPWRRRPVGEKVALSTALLLTALCTPSMAGARWVNPVVGSGIWPGALLAGIVSVIVILGPAHIRPRVLWQAMAAPIVFLILGGVSVLISLGSTPVGTVWWHAGVFSLGPVSTAQAMSLVEHGLCGTLTLMVLAVTTPMVDLLTWMRKLHIPDPLLEIASLTYRLIFVLLDTAVTASEAQHARLGDCPVGRFGGFNRRMNNTAALLGSVGIRAWTRANRLNDGLTNRGFESALVTLPVKRDGSARFKLIVVIVIVAVWAISWTMTGRIIR